MLMNGLNQGNICEKYFHQSFMDAREEKRRARREGREDIEQLLIQIYYLHFKYSYWLFMWYIYIVSALYKCIFIIISVYLFCLNYVKCIDIPDIKCTI